MNILFSNLLCVNYKYGQLRSMVWNLQNEGQKLQINQIDQSVCATFTLSFLSLDLCAWLPITGFLHRFHFKIKYILIPKVSVPFEPFFCSKLQILPVHLLKKIIIITGWLTMFYFLIALNCIEIQYISYSSFLFPHLKNTKYSTHSTLFQSFQGWIGTLQ